MAREDFADTPALSGSWSADERVTAFLRGVYGWMGAGLAVTAATAWFIANSPAAIQMVVGNRGLMWILLIAQLGIVVALSARVQQMAASTASLLFVGYAALTGVTLSLILVAYTGESVATTFIVTAGMSLRRGEGGPYLPPRQPAAWFLQVGVFWRSARRNSWSIRFRS